MEGFLNTQNFKCRVSSVLNKDVTQYGKMFMFDGKEDTCWCSENESPQWITVQWDTAVPISSFQMQFQGGFVGQNCEIIMVQEDGSKVIENFYPEDNNSIQTFEIASQSSTKQITLKFNASSDFFGRMIVYKFYIFERKST